MKVEGTSYADTRAAVFVSILLLDAIISPKLSRAGAEQDEIQQAFQALQARRDKYLGSLEDAEMEKLQKTISKLIPKRTYDVFFGFQPWYIWEYRKKDQPALWLLFEADTSRGVPGSTIIRITLDGAGKVASETTFTTGHRRYLQSVKVEKPIGAEYPIIAVAIDAEPNPPRQYYAKIGDRFDLVRLEGRDGKATRNRYHIRHFACGPPIPKQSEAEWEADLLSSDRLKVLRALVWLGGTHGSSKPDARLGKQAEDVEEVRLISRVCERPKVIARVKELVYSKDRWLEEAAELALEPPKIPSPPPSNKP